MDRNKVRDLRNQIEAALKSIPGLTFTVGNAKFDAVGATFQLIVADNASGSTKSATEIRAEEDFKKYASSYGIKQNLGDTIFHNHKPFIIVGLDMKSRKYPVLATNGGKTFKLELSAAGVPNYNMPDRTNEWEAKHS